MMDEIQKLANRIANAIPQEIKRLYVACSPAARAAVMERVRADVREHLTEIARQREAIEAEAQAARTRKAVTEAVEQLVRQMRAIQADIEAIRKSDRERKYLQLCNKYSHINGRVFVDHDAVDREMREIQ
jgi:hypothetical protein